MARIPVIHRGNTGSKSRDKTNCIIYSFVAAITELVAIFNSSAMLLTDVGMTDLVFV